MAEILGRGDTFGRDQHTGEGGDTGVGSDSGPAIAAEHVFAELNARYRDPEPVTKPARKRSA
jgi:hypothetical protein